jgi:heme/copper-type cytochrome/quinol oxidase subunit 2
MNRPILTKLLPVASTLLGIILGIAIGFSSPSPVSRDILIKARQYAYDPPKLFVNKGDTLNIRLASLDVVHGFFLEGYDVDATVYAQNKSFKFRKPSEGENWREVEGFTVIANRNGKFRYRCSHTCGTMHPFMQGELVVKPNSTFHAGIGGVVGLLVGMLGMFRLSITKLAKNKSGIGVVE